MAYHQMFVRDASSRVYSFISKGRKEEQLMHVRWSPQGLRRRVSYAGILAMSSLVVVPIAAQKTAPARPAAAAPSQPAPAAAGPERVDLDAIYRIKDEGLQRSRAMETLVYLTDVHGPRL